MMTTGGRGGSRTPLRRTTPTRAMTVTRRAFGALVARAGAFGATSRGAVAVATMDAPRVFSGDARTVPSRRGINTKSPLEDELERQRAIEAREKAQRELRENADAIAAGRAASSSKPRPPAAAFGAPIGTGGARAPSTPPGEKPKPKTTVVKAPTLGVAMHSDGRVGPAGNRNLMPEPPAEVEPPVGQDHLRSILAEGSFERFGVGGLDAEFLTIFRRVFASRMVPPDVVRRLGMRHVKGMLLHGPPGTGKTLVAKRLGELLNAHPPKIVNGPEILQRFVGQSEENMRDLFAPAEKEWKGKGEKSRLHVIVFDEIDAIMKARGTGGATASVVHDNVVNQLLTKLDGMQSLDNVLVVGITNRRDLLDPAVLRPGRLELQVEVGLPDRDGRAQIFNIHTAKMRAEGLLGECVDVRQLADTTVNYSGAEIKGMVGAAQSHALSRYLRATEGEDYSGAGAASDDESAAAASSTTVTMADFAMAANEVRPAMGADDEALAALRPLGTLCSCVTGASERSPHKRARDAIPRLLAAVADGGDGRSNVSGSNLGGVGGDGPRWLTVLVHGPPGSGKSAAVAEAAADGEFDFPNVQVFRADVAASSGGDVEHALRVAFDDAAKAKLSLIMLDGLETLLGIAPGDVAPPPPEASTRATHLLALLARAPPPGRRLAVVATTSSPEAIKALGLDTVFHADVRVPALTRVESENVLAATGAFGEDDGEKAAEFLTNATPMKPLLRAVQIAKALTPKEERKWGLDPVGDAWTTALKRVGLAGRGGASVFGYD